MQPNTIGQAQGKWRDILLATGIESRYLKNRHGPCPWCGGKDRYRWDNTDGSGSYICNQCGAGKGIDMVMKYLRLDFGSACREVDKHLGNARVEMPRAHNGYSRLADDLWDGSFDLTGSDPASRYLKKRGIALAKWPSQLRYHPAAPDFRANNNRERYQALVSRFSSPDNQRHTVHLTYVTEDGNKADLEAQKQLAPGKGSIPDGGAVKLFNAAETMGIAEGIETALSAMVIDKIPVWAALNSVLMAKWQPPENVRHVIVYADNDKNYTGQKFACSLANKLIIQNGINAEVRLPHEIGTDWNDELQSWKETA